jgi:hypothetical protein
MEKENSRMGIGYVDCNEVQYVIKSKDLKHIIGFSKAMIFGMNHVQAKLIIFVVCKHCMDGV